jgi:pyruvate/2-oxoglutarate dehydrogenase complex dihydrolipoamide dehydrogenase (E3) component
MIDGVNAAHVVQAADALAGAPLGRRVLVISEDDGPAPLSVADHLAGLGHQVTLVFQTPGPAPLVGKYSIGGMLRRLDEEGVVLVANARVVAISEAGADATLAHSFSNRRWTAGPFDSVVLACGAVANDRLYQELRAHHSNVHLLGDAYAPRRMIFATRQAWDLAKQF